MELAGAISDIARLYMASDFRHIDPSMAEVLILEGGPKILSSYPDDLQKKALEQLAELGVKVRTGAHVSDVQPGYVMVGEERIDAVVTLWAAGVQASPLGKLLGVEIDKRGAVFVDGHLNPPGHPEIFICGAPRALRAGREAGSGRCPTRNADGTLRRKADWPSGGWNAGEPRYWEGESFATSIRETWPPSVARPQWRRSNGRSRPTGVAFPPG